MNIKTCSKCGFVCEENLFVKGTNVCKKCEKEQRIRLKEIQKDKNKTCSKCGFWGKSKLCGRGNICKKCENEIKKEQRKKRIERQENENKTCSKCDFIGNEKLFVKGRNICKKCQTEYTKQRIKKQEGKDKTCSKCSFIGEEFLFGKGTNICKKCQTEYTKQRIKKQEGKDKTCSKCSFIGEEFLFGKGTNICIKCENENFQQWKKIRRENDPVFRLKEFCSRNIRNMLLAKNVSKAGKSCQGYLPFEPEELKLSIENKFEPWMNWDNQGSYKLTWVDEDVFTHVWNLDHFIPQSFLPYSSMKEKNFRIIWDLSNLRPLSAKQNVLDNNRRIITKIKNNQEFNDTKRLIFLLNDIINDEGIKPELIDLYNSFVKSTNKYKNNIE